MKMKKRSGGGGANWMDTYGDMVTLLLCFFVLLYSMSTIDEEKWKALVQSFNPNAVRTATENTGNQGPLSDPLDEDGLGMMFDEPQEGGENQQSVEEQIAAQEAAIDELYEKLKQYAEESGMAESISITRGDGYVFVSFDDAVFFLPDDYQLTAAGNEVLQAVSEILSTASEYIDEIRVMGHTAQASMNRPNYASADRFLSSNRATIAALYIQEHSTVDAARIVSMGFGQHRPIDTNENEEGRAHNRRVEMTITGYDILNEIGDSIAQYNNMREGGAKMTTSEGDGTEQN